MTITKKFQNEIAMISGGSLGIGLATARRLGASGARISICGRREDALREANDSLEASGIEVIAVQADVSLEDDVERWFFETEQRFGSATILVNNAGISGAGTLEEINEAQWDKTISVNCRGPFLCTKRAAAEMIKAKQGRIIFISSISSQYYRKDHSLYFASKWAVNGFAHCVAKDLQEHGVHVHIICPGMTETRFFDAYETGRPHPPEKHYVEPEMIAEMVEQFCALPPGFDTNEHTIVPSWQLNNLGLRR